MIIEFLDIKYDFDWVYAEAYDVDSGVRCKIKVHRMDEKFEAFGDYTGQMKYASWFLRDAVNRRKLRKKKEWAVTFG